MRILLAAVAISCAMLSGCTQFPTENRQAVDLRPQLSFVVTDPAVDPSTVEIFVNGLSAGQVSAYMAKQNALRVLSGSHQITARRGGKVIFEERMYLGDGMTRQVVIQ
ncbi:MAG: hypothetical protein NTW37_13205 [Proteobacteria bacterium]|nr:hypothetical protein [Pseudomonadota bacterium]